MAKTLGFYGPGKVAKRGISRFIPSHLGDDKGRFVFLVDDAWGDSLDRILDFAVESGDPLCIVAPGDEFIEDCKEANIPYVETDAPYDTFLDTIKAENGDLVLLWDDSSEENEENLTSMAEDAFQEGLAVYDLVHGMRELEPTEDAPEAAEDEPVAEADADEPEEDEADPYDAFLDAIDNADTPDDWDAIFLDKENRDHLVRLATELNLEFNPSSWQKRIAPVVKDALIDNEVFLKNDLRAAIEAAQAEVPEAPFVEEPPAEEHISTRVARENKQQTEMVAEATRVLERAAAEAEQDAADLGLKDRPENDRPTTGISLDALEHLAGDRLERARQEAQYDKQDLRHALTRVTERQGLEVAKEFYTFLKDNDLA